MKQREIWYADLNPTRGREQKGVRPVVIISGDTMNDHSDLCIVCPLTSQIKYFASGVLLKKDGSNKLKEDSEILAFQVRTVSQHRFTKKIGAITADQLRTVLERLIEVFQY